MLKVILCDDNPEAINRYAELIRQSADEQKVDIELSCYSSGEALLFQLWEAPYQADIIFLDIIMGELDGMETARKLRDVGCRSQIVFLTSCEDYVYEAFDVHAVHYLLKDELTAEKFGRVFARAAELASRKEDELFVCEFDGCKTPIPISRIVYFEIWKRIVTAHCDGNPSAKFYGSMEQLEQQFAGRSFVRAHRSYLVHLPYISQFQPGALLLKTGARIPIGGTYADSLRKAFSEYISRSHIHGASASKGGKP